MRNDRLQGILFDGEPAIGFADISSPSKRLWFQTRRAIKKVDRLKRRLPAPQITRRSRGENQLEATDIADIAERLHLND